MARLLYAFSISTCSHRVRLFLSMLGLDYQEVPVNLAAGEQRRHDFLMLNPAGQVPVLMEDGKVIFDSHAILFYLAEKYGSERWWQRDAHQRAMVLQWMFFACNELHNGVGLARNHIAFSVPGDRAAALARAVQALSVLNARLSDREWIALDRPTLADIACAPLIMVARDAKINVDDYPALAQWLERFKSLTGFIPFPEIRSSRAG